MSYRKKYNRHEHWKRALIKHRETLSLFGQQELILENSRTFELFLINGEMGYCLLKSFSDSELLAIETLVNYWFDEFIGGQDHLDAFNEEVSKQFGRYG